MYKIISLQDEKADTKGQTKGKKDSDKAQAGKKDGTKGGKGQYLVINWTVQYTMYIVPSI